MPEILLAKNQVQNHIMQAASKCATFLNQPHLEILSQQAVAGILESITDAGQCLNAVIESKDDVENVLSVLSEQSETEEDQIENFLVTVGDEHLKRVRACMNISKEAGTINSLVGNELYQNNQVDPEELKLSIGKMMRHISILCREFDVNIIDAISAIIQIMRVKEKD